MEGTYPLLLGSETVGTVQIKREGLYLRFCCRCRLPGDVMYKLQVSCGGKEANLGVLAPTGGYFGLNKRVSARHLGQGTPNFSLVRHREHGGGVFVPIYPEEPFAYIHKLENAFLAQQAGQLGIIIQDD